MAGPDFVVPVAMKLVAADVHLSKVRVRYFDPRLIGFGIQLSMNFEACFSSGRRDQIDDCLETSERLSTPVLGDVGEQPMFDLVPLAGSRREVAYRNAQPGFIGQLLQFDFPEPQARTVAAARVGGDQ
jgi:hypothetical protein